METGQGKIYNVLSHLKSSLKNLKWALSITLSDSHPAIFRKYCASPKSQETISYPFKLMLLNCGIGEDS